MGVQSLRVIPLLTSTEQNGLRIDRRISSGVPVLALYGELDLASRPVLDGELLDAQSTGTADLVVDLSQLAFIDVSGLHALLDAHARAHALGHQLLLVRGPRAVQRLFLLTGTDQIFRFAGSDAGLVPLDEIVGEPNPRSGLGVH